MPVIGIKIVSTAELYDRALIKCIKKVNKTRHGQNSSITDIFIVTGYDKFNRKKTITKASSTGGLKDRREANTSDWFHTALYTRVLVNFTKRMKKHRFGDARLSINL